MTGLTKDALQELLNRDDQEFVGHVVGRALVVLFNRQTADEQVKNDTNEDNGIGFTGADAHSGTITAKSYLKYKKLQDWQIERWTKKNPKGYSRLAKYWKQLAQAAAAKQQQQKEAA